MRKADRKKYEDFVLAELANGGKLEVYTGTRGAAPKYLRTIEDVLIELPSTTIARELINEMKVIRKACQDGWFITPLTPFDAKDLGKRREVYRVDLASTYVSYGGRSVLDEKRVDKIKTVIHIVTPFGTFGQCGIHGTHPTVEAARKSLKRRLKEQLKEAKKDRREAINKAEERWVDAQIELTPRIDQVDTIEPEVDDE